MPDPDNSSIQVDEIFTWLAGEPDDDVFLDLAALRAQFGRFFRLDNQSPRMRRCLGLFYTRALDLCCRIEARLMSADLPLDPELYAIATGLISVMLDIAASCQQMGRPGRSRWVRAREDSNNAWNMQALHLVSKAYLVSCVAGAAAPLGLWLWAHTLHAKTSRNKVAAAAAGSDPHHYLRLLSIAVIQPESLTARELVWLFEYLEGDIISLAKLSDRLADDEEKQSYWIDIDQDRSPMAIARRALPEDSHIWYFNPAHMAEHIAVQIEALEDLILEADIVGLERNGGALLYADSLGLPEGLAPLEALSLLRRLYERWSEPVMRKKARRECNYTVQAHIGLKAAWECANEQHLESKEVPFSEWSVLNESAGGYTLISSGRIEAVLSPGVVMILRKDELQPWIVCVVRWLHSGNPNRVEVGLQIISHSFEPVRVIFQRGDMNQKYLGLILPPMVDVRKVDAILAPSGACPGSRFMLLYEKKRFYVAQGKVVAREMQTSAIEVFQYEVDPYPD